MKLISMKLVTQEVRSNPWNVIWSHACSSTGPVAWNKANSSIWIPINNRICHDLLFHIK